MSDDPFEGSPPVPATSPWNEWFEDFFLRLLVAYGHVSGGEQQIAARLGRQLYGDGFDSCDGCRIAMERARNSSDKAKSDAYIASEISYIGAKQKYPKIFD